jgi:hypothetical protein
VIVEALRHAVIRCPRPLKRLGVLHDLIALDARARRQSRAWAPHREACHAAILGFAERPAGRRLAVVIGTGLLLEIPLEALAGRFDRVLCLDLFHMPAVRRRAGRLANVILVDHDVTGLLDALPKAAATAGLPTPEASLPFAAEADLVVSANLVSQLPLAPVAAAGATGRHSPLALDAWARRIVASHFEALSGLAGAVGLIADVARHKTPAGETRPVDWWDPLNGAALPALEERREWWWDIAPAPEEERRFDYRHRVVAGMVAGRMGEAALTPPGGHPPAAESRPGPASAPRRRSFPDD